PTLPPFPYTTLFRSRCSGRLDAGPVPAATGAEGPGLAVRNARAGRARAGGAGAFGHRPNRLRVVLPDRLGLLQLRATERDRGRRSEEHTSELQSPYD